MSPRSKEISKKMRGMTREAIYSASLELFAKHGYSATHDRSDRNISPYLKGSHFHTFFSNEARPALRNLDERSSASFLNFSRQRSAPAKERFIALVNSWLQVIKNEPLARETPSPIEPRRRISEALEEKREQYFERRSPGLASSSDN